MSAADKGIASVSARLFAPDGDRAVSEQVVVEAPLEIRVAGDPLSLTMRTPGDDRALVLGFLLAEGVISELADVGSIYHCVRPDEEPARQGNSMEVVPASGGRLDADRLDRLERLERSRRSGLTTSACGVCGRDAIDDLLTRARPVIRTALLSRELIARAPSILQEHQRNHARTGGLHAAAALDPGGAVVAVAEDIGRHNAVDKVVGQLLLGGQLPSAGGAAQLLVVSSRASFEVVQKAAVAGFPGVVTVSAPSSLAVETAEAAGITLAAFAREGRFTVYSHPQRIQ